MVTHAKDPSTTPTLTLLLALEVYTDVPVVPAVARGTACSGTPRVVVLLGRTLTVALNVEH